MKTCRPVYQQIRNHLAKCIVQGHYQPNTLLPTISELARKFNTSASTAAYALNLLDEEGLIRCRKGRPARVLPLKHKNGHWNIAVSVGLPEEDYQDFPYHGGSTIWTMHQLLIEQLLKDHHIAFNISGKEWERYCVPVDGLILLRPLDYSSSSLEKLNNMNLPYVTIETYLPQPPENNIVSLELAPAMAQAAIRFLSCGVRTICAALIPGNCTEPTDDRFANFFRTLQDQHFDMKNLVRWPSLVNTDGTAQPEMLEKYVIPILQNAPRPIGILSCSDIFCVDLIQAAQRCGLELKKDLYLIGCSGLPISAFTTPPLTTIEMPFSRMISSGSTMLYSMLENKTTVHPGTKLHAKLVIRGT